MRALPRIRVENMTSPNGNKISNQFTIMTDQGLYFQSYDTVIALKQDGKVYLDHNAWNYSRTTSKYRGIFLGETTKETEAKIKSGEYELVELN